MGSLMAGWDSIIKDQKAVKYQRNRSLTKERIESYWKLQKQSEEQKNKLENILEEGRKVKYQRSASMPPLPNSKGNTLEMETGHEFDKLLHKNGWWESSKWAFLNEKPVIESEGPIYKYASQYHVAATKNSSKPQPSSGIST